jgi:hypothetical protein
MKQAARANSMGQLGLNVPQSILLRADEVIPVRPIVSTTNHVGVIS